MELKDNNDLYLISTGRHYEVVSIEKINMKSLRLSNRCTMHKNTFVNNAYRLTEQEVKCFRGEMIKDLSSSRDKLLELERCIIRIQKGLNQSEFLTLNTEAFQTELNRLQALIATEIPSGLDINGEKFIINYLGNLTKIKEGDC